MPYNALALGDAEGLVDIQVRFSMSYLSVSPRTFPVLPPKTNVSPVRGSCPITCPHRPVGRKGEAETQRFTVVAVGWRSSDEMGRTPCSRNWGSRTSVSEALENIAVNRTAKTEPTM